MFYTDEQLQPALDSLVLEFLHGNLYSYSSDKQVRVRAQSCLIDHNIVPKPSLVRLLAKRARSDFFCLVDATKKELTLEKSH